MCKICRKCGAEIPPSIVVEGKRRNLCSRQFCLSCSPFGSNKFPSHNLVAGQEFEFDCPKHGITIFVAEQNNRRRCKKCRVEAVTKARQERKKKLIEHLGGCCLLCGYNKCQQSLQFHHIDPNEKEFGISEKGACRSLDEMIKEVNKCVLLCANCHFEVENGITELAIPREVSTEIEEKHEI